MIYRVYKLYVHSLLEIYEINWGIELPDDLEQIYHMSTPKSFHGDGFRYTILKNEKESMKFEGFNKGSWCINIEFAEKILEELDIPIEHQPDFNMQYIWRRLEKYNNTLLLLYDEIKKTLYIFEELM